jgi:hypothetical protein
MQQRKEVNLVPINPAKYAAKLIPQNVMEDLTTQKGSMRRGFFAAARELVVVECRTRAVLSGEAVVTIDYPLYHAYAREIWKLKTRFGGGSALTEEVALLLAKWKANGLGEQVLNKVRDEVFGIPAPGAP